MLRRPVALYVTLAAADTALAAAGHQRLRRGTKPLLMPALMPGRDRRTRRALALSCAGDVALLGGGPATFTAGLSCFLGGHLAWIASIRSRPSRRLLRRNPALALPYLTAWVGLNAYLWPRTGRDRIAVVVYSMVLLAMALTALDSGEPAAAGGGALFLTSDSLLALERFGGIHLSGHEAWVMASYTAAQGLLAASGNQCRDGAGTVTA